MMLFASRKTHGSYEPPTVRSRAASQVRYIRELEECREHAGARVAAPLLLASMNMGFVPPMSSLLCPAQVRAVHGSRLLSDWLPLLTPLKGRGDSYQRLYAALAVNHQRRRWPTSNCWRKWQPSALDLEASLLLTACSQELAS